ncbi:MAG: hypothetical protein HDT38_03705 [Clostridiales bacterium]|nr:hypothetical protein [Clostridiales bacterium]
MARLMAVSEVSYENRVRRFPCALVYADIRMEQLIRLISRGSLGILGPILLVLLCLWLGRGDRSPWYVKAILVVLLILLMLITLSDL